jgi:hypothetical protein
MIVLVFCNASPSVFVAHVLAFDVGKTSCLQIAYRLSLSTHTHTHTCPMASFSGAMVKMAAVAAICIAVAFLSMGSPAMADQLEECRSSCRPACDALDPPLCRSIVQTSPFLKDTCEVRMLAWTVYATLRDLLHRRHPAAGGHPNLP